MGTHRAAGAEPVRQEVSNPLGWDGDVEADQKRDRQIGVSNPLGWDGDRRSGFREGNLRWRF